jgi:hypothetical protein
MPLTYQGERNPFSIALNVGYGSAGAFDGDFDGYELTARFHYRFDRRTTLGGGLTLGSFSGTAQLGPMMGETDVDLMPVNLSIGIEALWIDRVWTGAYVGVQFDRVTAFGSSEWSRTAGVELVVGVDVLEIDKRNRFGLFGRIDSAPLDEISFSAFTAGLAFRRKL